MAATLAGWHEVYVTVGAAAGTLVGLLFVGLSSTFASWSRTRKCAASPESP